MERENLNFEDREALQNWLKGKPIGWEQVIATRAAMRAAPMLAQLRSARVEDSEKDRLQVSLFRALLISFAAHRLPTDHKELRGRLNHATGAAEAVAVRVARASGDGAVANAASSAAASAASAAFVAYSDSVEIALRAVDLSAQALTKTAAAAWGAVSWDAAFLDKGGELSALALQPLWPGGVPGEVATHWATYKTYVAEQDAGFALWVEWYEAAAGWNGPTPYDAFGDDLTRHIALQPNDWWDRDVRAVNADIAQWRKNPPPISPPPIDPEKILPHYANDAIDERETVVDRLGVGKDARVFARLLAAEDTKLPLAVGLFGPWGGGKSFFMKLMRQEMDALAKAKVPGYHDNVAHITFNAWHYVDADLWASLGLRIFEGVAEHLGGKKPSDLAKQRETLGKSISSNERIKEEAKLLLDAAKKARVEAASKLEKEQEKREKQVDGGVLAVIKAAAGPTWTADMGKIAVAVGVATPQNLKDLEAVVEEARRAKEAAEKWLPRWAKSSEAVQDNLMWAAAVAIGLLVASFAPGARAFWGDVLSLLLSAGSAVIAAVAGWAAWLTPMLKKARDAAALAETYKIRIDEARKAQAPAAPDDKALAELDGEIATLQGKIAAIDGDIAIAQARFHAADSGMLIYEHLTERAKDARYVDRQGVVAVLRRDLEHLQDHLETLNHDTAKIKRIILFIDDLDRCEPARVVEVLQAVHLLLAFPLFAVVVAVDPRWLERSLYEKYDPQRADASVFSPRSYMEKIFQIPYRLKPKGDGLSALVGELTGKLIKKETATETPTERAAPTVQTPSNDAPKKAEAQPQEPASPPPPPPPSPSPSPSPPPPKLELTQAEADAMTAAHPFIPTPRALKRLFNVYLLVRLRNPAAADTPGVVITLLGLEIGFPEAGRELLRKIRAAGENSNETLAKLADAGPLEKALQTAAPGVTAKQVYPWLKYAERFSFDGPE